MQAPRSSLIYLFLSLACTGCTDTGQNTGALISLKDTRNPGEMAFEASSSTVAEVRDAIPNFDELEPGVKNAWIGTYFYPSGTFLPDSTYTLTTVYRPNQYFEFGPPAFYRDRYPSFQALLTDLNKPVISGLEASGLFNELFGSEKTYQTVVAGDFLQNGMTTASWITNSMFTAAVYLDESGNVKDPFLDQNGNFLPLNQADFTNYAATNTDAVLQHLDQWANCMVEGNDSPETKYETIHTTESLGDTSSWQDAEYAETLTESMFEFGIGAGAFEPYSAIAASLQAHYLRSECSDKAGNQDPANYSGPINASTTDFFGMCADGSEVNAAAEAFSLNLGVNSDGKAEFTDEDDFLLPPGLFLDSDTKSQGTVDSTGTLLSTRRAIARFVDSPNFGEAVSNTITGIVVLGEGSTREFAGMVINRQIQFNELDTGEVEVLSDCFILSMSQSEGFADSIPYWESE